MKAFVVNRVGDWGVICGLGLLFWGLGGAWVEHGRYHSDFRARFAAVEIRPLAEEDEAEEGHAAGHGTMTESRPRRRRREENEGARHERAGHLEDGGKQRTANGPAVGTDRPKPRDVSAHKKPPRQPGSKGLLTMTTHPGAMVYKGVNDAVGPEHQAPDQALSRAGRGLPRPR